MPTAWRRTACLGGSVAMLSFLLACGSSSNTATVLTGDPPGDVTSGTGSVADSTDATQRVLTQFLGLPATRQAGTPFVGTGDQPFVNLYLASDGALPAGTLVTDRDPDSAVYELNAPYFLFWLDPDPLAQLGHLCYLLFVATRDGRIIATPAEFDPQIGTSTPLLFREDKLARVVYEHQIWRDEQMAVAQRGSRQVLANGQMAKGLYVGGNYEFDSAKDIEMVEGFLKNITGEDTPLDSLLDKKDDRIDEHELAAKLRDASAGLGEGDKFYFVISSHASKNGKVNVGSDWLTWEQLCEILDQNVSAQYLNIIISACYSGLADAKFKNWDAKTDKGVRWFTVTDGTHPSYVDSDGSFGIRCALKALMAALAGARTDGQLTVAELEAAMAALGTDVTGDEIRKKICDKYKPINLAWWNDFEKDDGDGDKVRPQGDPVTGGFAPAQPAVIEVPQSIIDFSEQIRLARLANDPVQLLSLFDPMYLYDGLDRQQVVQGNPQLRVVDYTFDQLTFNGLAGNDQLIVDSHRVVQLGGDTLTGNQLLMSEQFATELFELNDGLNGPLIFSDRLARWNQFDQSGMFEIDPHSLLPELPPGQIDDNFLGTGFEEPLDTCTSLPLGETFIPLASDLFAPRSHRQDAGTRTDGVFVSLASNTVQLQPDSATGQYTGRIPIPTEPGRWVLKLYATTRIDDPRTGAFVSASQGRSIEVRVGDCGPANASVAQ